jgi:hypothetical protein
MVGWMSEAEPRNVGVTSAEVEVGGGELLWLKDSVAVGSRPCLF